MLDCPTPLFKIQPLEIGAGFPGRFWSKTTTRRPVSEVPDPFRGHLARTSETKAALDVTSLISGMTRDIDHLRSR
jgi:hypothetical protein